MERCRIKSNEIEFDTTKTETFENSESDGNSCLRYQSERSCFVVVADVVVVAGCRFLCYGDQDSN